MSSIRSFSSLAVICLLVQLTHLSAATAQRATSAESSAVESSWSAKWARPGWTEATLAGGLFAGSAVVQFGIGPPEEPRWHGPILADAAVRNGLLADSSDGEAMAARASDYLVFALIGTSALIEPALVWSSKGDMATAGRMALINAQSLAITLFSTVALKHTIGRQRPAVGVCWDDPEARESCGEREALSFPSGHTSTAFAGAGLVCLNHEVMEPFGSGWDRATCYTALGAAAATGTLRMVANKHFMTDVVVGATLGLGAGYFLPKWLYFGFGDGPGALSAYDVSIVPSFGQLNGAIVSFAW